MCETFHTTLIAIFGYSQVSPLARSLSPGYRSSLACSAVTISQDDGLGPAVVAGHEDHAEGPRPARSDRVVMKRAEIDEVVGHHGAMLRASDVHHRAVEDRLVPRIAVDRFDIVAARAQLLGDDGREQLVEQEPQRRSAAWPASQAV